MKYDKIIYLHTHPINYFCDQYRYLSKRYNLEVWFCSDYGLNHHYDKEFDSIRVINDDILKGLKTKFLKNIFTRWNPKSRRKPFLNYNLFSELIKIKKNTIIVCHGWSNLTNIFVLFFSFFYPFKVALRAESPLSHERKYSKFKLLIRKIFFKILFQRIDYFFFIGTQNKNFYRFYGVSSEKLYFMPYSVEKFNLNINTNFSFQNRIIFSGKLIDKKNPKILIQALSRIKNKSVNLLFAGNGPLINELEKDLDLLRLHKRVQFLGLLNKENLIQKYLESDVLILPSSYGETWGLVINEALYLGMPVIVSDRVGSSIDLCNGNGFIFEYGNINQLVKLINDFYCLKEDEVIEMKKNSLKLINNYSFDVISKNLEELLQFS